MPKTVDLTQSRHHHGSHRQLLTQHDHRPGTGVPVDAVIVPTARPGRYLRRAIHLAATLNCVLVALCSRRASIEDAERRARVEGIELLAVDTTRLPAGLMPAFATTALLAGTPFERRQDTSLKRNLGLLFAWIAGWQRIVFVDDDILIPVPEDLRHAAALLDTYSGVGLHIDGFPDNSVVCHAYRMMGGRQDTFVGGGALAVGAASLRSFFPRIYNEDWFFLLDSVRLRPTAVTGAVKQTAYDPFTDHQRAKSEEFGDTLAEGVFWLLDLGRRVQDADICFWRAYLDKRRKFLDDVVAMVGRSDTDPVRKARMLGALKAARERNQLIQPQFCADYLRAWRIDRTRWRRHIDRFCGSHNKATAEKVLSELGLWACSKYVSTDVREPLPLTAAG